MLWSTFNPSVSMYRAKKQSDRDIIVHQKETNKALEEEIERLNLEQQRLKEIGNSIRIETRDITRTIVMIDETPHQSNNSKHKSKTKTKRTKHLAAKSSFPRENSK